MKAVLLNVYITTFLLEMIVTLQSLQDVVYTIAVLTFHSTMVCILFI